MKKIMICLLALLFAGNAHAFGKDMIEIHGFVSQGCLISTEHDFWFADTEDGTFQFNEIGLNVTTEPVDNLRIGVQLLSRDLGELGNNEVKIDWAFGDYYFREWLGIRAGILKRPHGLYNQSRDIDAARTSIFLPSGIYPEVYRDWVMRTQGVGIYGTLPGDVSYEIQYGTFSMETDSGVAKVIASLVGGKIDDISTDDVFAVGLRWDTPLPGLAFSFTWYRLGDIRTDGETGQLNTTKFEDYVASVLYEIENLTFSASYRQVVLTQELNGYTFADDYTTEAYYASAAYRFTDWFELGVGYSVYYDNKDDRDGDFYEDYGMPAALAWLKDLSLSTRFDINEHWIFKLEGHYMNGLAFVTSDLGNDPSEDWFLFAAKTTLSF